MKKEVKFMSQKILEMQKMSPMHSEKAVARKSSTSSSCTLKSAVSLFC